MPFFANAQSVVINGGKFEEIHGDQTIHNGHVYNINSFNRTNNMTSGSFNNSSANWRGAGGRASDIEQFKRRAQEIRDEVAQNRPNYSRTASAPQNHPKPPTLAPPTPPPAPASARPCAGVSASYPPSPHQEIPIQAMRESEYANLSEAELRERLRRLTLDLDTTATSPGGSEVQSPKPYASRMDTDSDSEGEVPKDKHPIATQPSPLLSSSPSQSPVPPVPSVSVSVTAPSTPAPTSPTPLTTAPPAASAPALLVPSVTPSPPSPTPESPTTQASAPKKQRKSKNPLRRMKYIFNSKTGALTSMEMSE